MFRFSLSSTAEQPDGGADSSSAFFLLSVQDAVHHVFVVGFLTHHRFQNCLREIRLDIVNLVGDVVNAFEDVDDVIRFQFQHPILRQCIRVGVVSHTDERPRDADNLHGNINDFVQTFLREAFAQDVVFDVLTNCLTRFVNPITSFGGGASSVFCKEKDGYELIASVFIVSVLVGIVFICASFSGSASSGNGFSAGGSSEAEKKSGSADSAGSACFCIYSTFSSGDS